MKWQDIAANLGIKIEGLDDSTGPAKVTETIQSLVAERSTLAASLQSKATEITGLQASVTRLNSAKNAPEIPGEILDEHACITEAKLANLAERRIITPGMRDKFKALFCGEKDKRPALCLSKSAAEHAGLPSAVAASVIDILGMGTAGTTGKSQTGAQGAAPTGEELSDDDMKNFGKAVGERSR